jgi:GNAT superfamily N-acetyltransferase
MTMHTRLPAALRASHARSASHQPRLPGQITLEHGPRDRLGAFFLAADKAARDRGVYLSLSTDFELLRRVNRMNLEHWHGLAPSFDAAYGGIDASNGYWLIGRDADGAIVSTQAAHFYAMGDETLQDYLCSLRLFYPDPARQKRDGESCSVTAPSAALIRGRVVFSGSTWIHPDYRGRALPKILPRLSRALALTRWNTDHTISLVSQALVEKGVARAYGYSRIEPGITWLGSAVSPRYEGALVWMPQSELLADIASFEAEMQAEAERGNTQRPTLPQSSLSVS